MAILLDVWLTNLRFPCYLIQAIVVWSLLAQDEVMKDGSMVV